MFVTPSRRQAGKIARRTAIAAATCFLFSALCAAPSMAAGSGCEGQVFTQPFSLLGDLNSYTLVPGSQFNSPEEGWQLNGGAQVAETNRPYGLDGNVLAMSAGSQAVSPSECVTPLYPAARLWLRRTGGTGAVKVSVAYAGTRSEAKPKEVAELRARGVWTAVEPFPVRPDLGGEGDEAREVKFYLEAHGTGVTYQVFELYVDPRMI